LSHDAHDHNPHGQPHFKPVTRAWAPLAARLRDQILMWPDTHQLGVFGRHGYYLNNYLFATLPIHEEALVIWVRLAEADAAALASHPQASQHDHGVRGWMRFRIETDQHVTEALTWVEKAYKQAVDVWVRGVEATFDPNPEGGRLQPLGAPIHLVPEATGKPDHKIPQGPISSRFITGLAVEGAFPQPQPSAKG
jgi:hypothetical protein